MIKSQRLQIFRYLSNGGNLTPLAALNMFGCLRLGARIMELRVAGHDIRTAFVRVGRHKRVAEYSMPRARK